MMIIMEVMMMIKNKQTFSFINQLSPYQLHQIFSFEQTLPKKPQKRKNKEIEHFTTKLC